MVPSQVCFATLPSSQLTSTTELPNQEEKSKWGDLAEEKLQRLALDNVLL